MAIATEAAPMSFVRLQWLFLFISLILVFATDRELPVYSLEERAKIAYEFHENAVMLVQQAADTNDYGECLSYFRAAVRLQPDNPTYLTDLGVTEMRVGELTPPPQLRYEEMSPTEKMS